LGDGWIPVARRLIAGRFPGVFRGFKPVVFAAILAPVNREEQNGNQKRQIETAIVAATRNGKPETANHSGEDSGTLIAGGAGAPVSPMLFCFKEHINHRDTEAQSGLFFARPGDGGRAKSAAEGLIWF
jgi:hypothetical protein